MPPSTQHTLASEFAAFLTGNDRAGDALYRRLRGPLLRQASRHAPNLPPDIAGEVVAEVFVLMMKNCTRFNPARGSAEAFIFATLLPEAVRRTRADYAAAGTPKRRRKPGRGTLPPPSLDEVPEPRSAGYGSPEAMEAACDAHAIWSRSTPPMRLIIGGLLHGKTQVEIAAETKMDRFRVGRMICGLQRQVAAVA